MKRGLLLGIALLAGAAYLGWQYLDEGSSHDRMDTAVLRSNLSQLVRAQDAYHTAHGVYAESLAQLPDTLTWTTGMTLTIRTDAGRGFSAMARYPSHEPGSQLECSVFVGAVAAPSGGMRERRPHCP